MDDKELARHLRALEDGPEDPDRWLALARDLDRSERPTPDLDPALLAPFQVAWKAAPEARELERFFQVLTHMVPDRRHLDTPPSWLQEAWVDSDDPSQVPYHRELGLPMAATRLEDRQTLWLWPGGPVVANRRGEDGVALVLQTGYVVSQFVVVVEAIPGGPLLQMVPFEMQMEFRGELVPELPERRDLPLPMSRFLGRRLAHGLTPEDREPLPPPPLPMDHPIAPMPRLSGAPPMHLGGAAITPDPVPRRRSLIQWIKDLFDR
jgi:hypothetical protein